MPKFSYWKSQDTHQGQHWLYLTDKKSTAAPPILFNDPNQLLRSIKDGKYPLRMESHVLILNWNTSTISLLRQFAFARSCNSADPFFQRPIAILADMPKQTMDDTIADRLRGYVMFVRCTLVASVFFIILYTIREVMVSGKPRTDAVICARHTDMYPGHATAVRTFLKPRSTLGKTVSFCACTAVFSLIQLAVQVLLLSLSCNCSKLSFRPPS